METIMSDLLKEAIADAKAVRETALQNAKMALEEAFTPHLKSMLSAKLAEDDIEEDENPFADKDEDEEDVEEEEEEAEEELGYNECRMSDDNKVSCPSCDSRLGVPRGSTPPFRFSCPSCDNKIRVIE